MGNSLRSTEEYNAQMVEELSEEEKKQIACGTAALARHFGYDSIPYLKKYYAE